MAPPKEIELKLVRETQVPLVAVVPILVELPRVIEPVAGNSSAAYAGATDNKPAPNEATATSAIRL